MNHLSLRSKYSIVVLLVVCLKAYSFSVWQSPVNTQSVKLENIDYVTITYGSDNITFYESDTNELIIKEYMNQKDSRYFARIAVSDKTINIKNGRRPWFSFLISEIEVYLPKEYIYTLMTSTTSGKISSYINFNLTNLNLSSTSGSIKLKNINAGNINVRTTSGLIQIENINANSIINTTSGQISINNIVGNTDIISTSGRIIVNDVQGDSFIKSTSGSVSLGNLLGSKQNISTNSGAVNINEIQAEIIKLKSISGKINIGRAFGNTVANSTSGTILLARAGGSANLGTISGSVQANYVFVDGDIFVKTTSGKITLNIPEDISCYFDLSAVSVSVRVVFPDGSMYTSKIINTQLGNTPINLIKINTVSGSIDVSTRAAIRQDIRDLPQII